MIYAVNKWTKEHRVITEHTRYTAEHWNYVSADPDGWIEWQGGECPLPCGARFDVKLSGGSEITNQGAARWEHVGGLWDIIAYRPILDDETKPEPPAWDGEGLPPVGCECKCRESAYGAKGDFAPCRTVHKTAKGVILVEFDHGDFGHGCAPGDFRPIRSEEDRVVDEMADVMREADGAVLTGRTQESIARALYRAGYRKTGAN